MDILLRRAKDGNIVIDTEDVPDNLEELAQRAFEEYTQGTRREYMFMDKLRFIDLMIRRIHGDGYAFKHDENIVRELMRDHFDYMIDEEGEIPDESDYLSIEFMEECYSEGRKNQELAAEVGDSHRDFEELQRAITRIIRAVMNYEADNDGSRRAEI